MNTGGTNVGGTNTGGTLARAASRGLAALRLARLTRTMMQGEEPRASVLLAALAGAWRCRGVKLLRLPVDGVAVAPGEAPGLRLYWIEGSVCTLSTPHAGGGRETLAPASSLVVLPRASAHQLKPQHGMAWALSAEWPASVWCASLLTGEAPLAAPLAPHHQPDILRTLRTQAMADPAGADRGALHDACAQALVERALALTEAAPAQSMLASALAHARLGPWLRDALTQTGALPALDDCAALCHLSRAAFTRQFAGATGLSFAEFMTRWRMNAALHRMVLGQIDVAEAAALYGYESEASFRKAFRRATGLTPGAARRAGGIDAAFGWGDPRSAAAVSAAPIGKPSPRVSVTTHTQPPDLAAMLSAVITGL